MIRKFIKSIPNFRNLGLNAKVALAVLGVVALTNAPQKAFSQVVITSTVPTSTAPMDVCGLPAEFTITFEAVGGATETGNTVTLSLPTDIEYVPGSASGTAFASEGNISNLQNAVINLVDIPDGETRTLSFQARAYCGRINSAIQIHTYDYNSATISLNSFQYERYNIRYAAFTIISVTNQNYFGPAGSTYTRTVTVRNGGFGKIDHVTVEETNDNGLQIISVSGATSSVSLPATATVFTITNFTGIGNGDNFLDGNEQVSFTETVQVPGTNLFCGGGGSGSNNTEYDAYYGCNGNGKCPVTNSTDISDQETAGATWNNPNPSFNLSLDETAINRISTACVSANHTNYTT